MNVSAPAPAAPDTRLYGRPLLVARIAWAVLMTLILGLFAVAVPVRLDYLETMARQPDSPVLKLSLSPDLYVAGVISIETIVVLAFVLTAFLIVWRKSDDRVALY